MTTPVVVYGFETSNNVKVRVALGYKDIAYQFRAIDPASRELVVELSGQHLTPVMVHDDTVLYDSAAILRYLDANFRGTPRLFGSSRDEQWEVEDWEFFGRTKLAGPMLYVVHNRVAGKPVDDDDAERCALATAAAIEQLADRLSGRAWLVGGALSAADITAAAVLWRLRTGGMFPLPPIPSVVEAWQDRILSYDGKARLA